VFVSEPLREAFLRESMRRAPRRQRSWLDRLAIGAENAGVDVATATAPAGLEAKIREADVPMERRRDRAHRRRAVERGSAAEPVSRRAVWERDGGRCHLCGHPVELDAMHLDHLVPISQGGEHRMANVAAAHAFCNLSRWTRPVDRGPYAGVDVTGCS
jgi:hypothetical protein